MMRRMLALALISVALSTAVDAKPADNLRLNPHLDYSSDTQDGPLITGDNIEDGVVRGQPNYVFMYGEACFNSKRQARRSVSLYKKYRERVQFVIIDLDKRRPAEQQDLVEAYYRGFIPHVVILDGQGNVVYNHAGEVSEPEISRLLDTLLQTLSR